MLAAAVVLALAYVGPCPGSRSGRAQSASVSRVTEISMGYVPDGLTAEQYKKIKEKERQKKNLGATGTNRFQSRSMYAFMKAKERGEATNLFPVNPQLVKEGKIKPEDVPYMQRRGGRWDQSDVKGAKKRSWNRYDKAYENGGRDADSSVSIFGGASLPWTTQALKGMSNGPDAEMVRQWKRMGVKVDKNGNPITAAAAKQAKRPKAGGVKGQTEEEPKKKLFGLF